MVCSYYVPWRNDDSVTISTTASALANGEIISSYELSYETAVIRRVNKLMDEYFPKTACIACGTHLDAVTRGRKKFCANCGVYLPRIIYDNTAQGVI